MWTNTDIIFKVYAKRTTAEKWIAKYYPNNKNIYIQEVGGSFFIVG